MNSNPSRSNDSSAAEHRLSEATPGQPLTVSGLPANGADFARLQAMGLWVGRQVELERAGNPAIIRVAGSRVGVSSQLVESILVRAMPLAQVA